ncbi:hypothetical protein PoMZ_05059, partial [Pyricularia oryzae]
IKQYCEYNIEQACIQIVSGVGIRKAAIQHGIPYTTLHGRIRGAQPISKAKKPSQRLSATQEAHLSTWVRTQTELGLPPTYKDLRQLANRVLLISGVTQPLGKHWINGFLARHPSLKVQRSLRIDSQRVNGAITEIIRNWWRRLNHPEIKPIKPENRWNMDEAGIL